MSQPLLPNCHPACGILIYKKNVGLTLEQHGVELHGPLIGRFFFSHWIHTTYCTIRSWLKSQMEDWAWGVLTVKWRPGFSVPLIPTQVVQGTTVCLVIQMTRICFSCLFELCSSFLPHSYQNPWNFLLRMIQVSFVKLLWLMPVDGGWLPGEPAMWLDAWTFQSQFLTCEEGESITNGQWVN